MLQNIINATKAHGIPSDIEMKGELGVCQMDTGDMNIKAIDI